ncbi:MAG: DUF3293 domain-containing protein [Betaproteobacteria bacterium]|nr:DUF3293 domain-containing protein [Betaproteobacteria bacterium]MCL2886103.1 DUF3293 domain-containing protein [Betaproteobacteria bacterium]
MRSDLEAAYRATTYRVFLPDGPLDLRLDRADECLRRWLAATGCRCFAILTACNPGSQPLGNEANAERQAQLECKLLATDYEPFAGENIADDGVWPVEESCFVPNLKPATARALAADFGQSAIVCGESDGVPRLVWV